MTLAARCLALREGAALVSLVQRIERRSARMRERTRKAQARRKLPAEPVAARIPHNP